MLDATMWNGVSMLMRFPRKDACFGELTGVSDPDPCIRIDAHPRSDASTQRNATRPALLPLLSRFRPRPARLRHASAYRKRVHARHPRVSLLIRASKNRLASARKSLAMFLERNRGVPSQSRQAPPAAAGHLLGVGSRNQVLRCGLACGDRRRFIPVQQDRFV